MLRECAQELGVIILREKGNVEIGKLKSSVNFVGGFRREENGGVNVALVGIGWVLFSTP